MPTSDLNHVPGGASRGRQQGAALLLIMLGLIIATSTILLSGANRDALRARQIEHSQAMLSEAKAALLDFAVTRPDLSPGSPYSFPCPDIDDSGGFSEGVAHEAACGVPGVSMIGRLPWKTLGIPALKDAASACLWYAVSGSHKMAGLSTAALINQDTNGQFRLINADTGSVVEGLQPEDRPVAMVFAAMAPLASQTRPGFSTNVQCTPGVDPANYLDVDSVLGINNATLVGVADALNDLAVVAGVRSDHNDVAITISGTEIARRIEQRQDHIIAMRSLGLAVAACIADYGAKNPAGVSDKRMPWPAPVSLSDYRPDASYDDSSMGVYAGRLANVVNDSNIATGNAMSAVLSGCSSATVPDWTPQQLARWQHFKDQFFYAVAASHSPSSVVPTSCGTCLTVNGAGQYAAIVVFSNSRLSDLGQRRNAPPLDTDTKMSPSNYLEGLNAANITAGGGDFVSAPASTTFNDLLFCIDEQLVVTEC